MSELRRVKIKFFNYFRMSGSTFNDLLKLEWGRYNKTDCDEYNITKRIRL